MAPPSETPSDASSGHSIWPPVVIQQVSSARSTWNKKVPFKKTALSSAPRKCLSEQMQMHTHKERTELCIFGGETTQLSGHGPSLRTQVLHNCRSQESVSHGWVDVTCFSSLQLTAASQRTQSGLKGYLASQPDWIPTQLSQLKREKWVFFGITKIKAAHGINNALKHTGKESFNQGSQLEVWVGIKTAHHSYG